MDLLHKCMNPNYVYTPFGTIEMLAQHGLTDSEGKVNEIVRKVMLNTFEMHGNDLIIVDPVLKA